MECPNCHTNNPLNAKFCLECGNRLLVCPNCGTLNLPIAKFCIECGTSLQPRGENTVPLPFSQSSNNGKNTLAPSSRQLTDSLLPPEERRVVTIMFADITSYTPLADRLEPEDIRAILTGYFNLMAEQIRRHGGTVEKYIGDAIMAVFGSPIAHEDDPDRAIRAALDMQKALKHFNERRLAQDTQAIQLQMRIGINTGEVAVPNNAQHQRRDFLITGDAVNVAARLQQAATPDTILVGERTYLTTRGVFEFRAIAPLQLKGKPEPLPAYVVLGLRNQGAIIVQHPRGIEEHPTRLVGRSLELTLLHANYARVRAERHPHLITILGTPGIGKSRLVHEFIDREQEKIKSASSTTRPVAPLVLEGHCPPYGEGITYWPLIEILRSLLQVREEETLESLQLRFTDFVKETLAKAKRTEEPDEIANTLLRSIGRGLSGNMTVSDGQGYRDKSRRGELPRPTNTAIAKQGSTQVALLRAWRVLLEALAEQQPLIIVVDDLQWADEALLDLLEYLTDRITSVPILFLCPARPDFFERRRDWGGGRHNFTTIALESLSREESSELVDELLHSSDLPEALRQTILARAEGNPFFVEEIVRMFIDQGLLVRAGESEDGTPRWRLSNQSEILLSEISTPTELPEDTLINRHYVLPLPRVPDTVQGVLAARIDLLNPIEKLILQHAAIAGRTFWLSALFELASDIAPEVVLDALDSLEQREFVAEDHDRQVRSPIEQDRIFIFKHILIRDVVYNNIPRMRRSQEHAHLALWMEEKTSGNREPYIELLAYHYQQALLAWSPGFTMKAIEISGSPDPSTTVLLPSRNTSLVSGTLRLTRPELRQKVINYLTLAGDQAFHSYYTIRALQAYNEAYEQLANSEAQPDELVRMHIKIGDACSQRGSEDEAWQEYRKALRIINEKHIELSSADMLGLYQRLAELPTRWLGNFDSPPDFAEVRTYIDAGLKFLENKPISSERVSFLTYLAFWYTRLVEQEEATTAEKKTTLMEQALASGQEALRQAEELNNPSVLSMTLDAVAYINGQFHKYNEAHQVTHRRQQLEPQLTDREELYDLYYSLGLTHERVCDYPMALMWFGRAWSNAQTMESPRQLLSNMVGRMRVWRQWNRWKEAREVAFEILKLIEQYQVDEKRQFWALETLSTIAYRMGNREEGDQYAKQCKRLVDQQLERTPEDSCSLVEARMHAIHLSREDWTLATKDYTEKLRCSEPFPSPEVVATLAELLVTTGASQEQQLQVCERAVKLGEDSGARKSLAVALRARGRMHTEQQNWSQAEDDLRQALQRCEVLDIPWERGNTLYYLGILYKRRASILHEDNTVRRNADLGRARYHFEQALGFYESVGANPSSERVRLTLMQDNRAPV